MTGVDYNETTSLTPAAIPSKSYNHKRKDLPLYHLDVSEASVQAQFNEDILMHFPI